MGALTISLAGVVDVWEGLSMRTYTVNLSMGGGGGGDLCSLFTYPEVQFNDNEKFQLNCKCDSAIS